MANTNRHIQFTLFVLITLGIGLLAISLPGQPVQGDEAAFGEFAWFQSQDGYVHSELFRGLLNYETRVLLYHKLFIWLGAGLISAFGFGLWPLRLLSLAAFALTAILLWRARENEGGEAGRIAGLAAIVFILISPLTFKFAKYYRPEMLQAALGFGSYLFAERGLRSRSTWAFALAGFAAGTAMLVHLNGVIFVIAGFLLLTVSRRWTGLSVFGLTALIAFAPFFIEIIGRFDLFWHQFAFDPTFVGNERSVVGTLQKLLDEHKRLFRSPEILFSTTTFLIAVIANIRRDRRTRQHFYIFTATAMLALGALAPAKTAPYAVLLYPLWALEVGRWIGHFRTDWRSSPLVWRWGLTAVIIVFVTHSLFADTINAVRNKQDWVNENRRASEVIPENVRVLAPLDFIFNELPHRTIAGFRLANWRIEEWGKKPYNLSTLTEYADSAGCGAIVLDQSTAGRIGVEARDSSETEKGFKQVSFSSSDQSIVYLKAE